MVPNLRPPQHEQTPADRFRAVTVCPRPSPAPIVHKTLALGRVQSEPLLALDRQKPARFVRHTYARWKVLRVDAYCGRRPGGQYLKRRGLYGEVPGETICVCTGCHGHFPIQPVEWNRGQATSYVMGIQSEMSPVARRRDHG
jgi:hypothetical protein